MSFHFDKQELSYFILLTGANIVSQLFLERKMISESMFNSVGIRSLTNMKCFYNPFNPIQDP